MNSIPTFASVARPATSIGPANGVSRRRFSLATLRSVITAWRRRMHFRRELERMLEDNPHLVDDIGLTRRQAESYIARPFWRVYGESSIWRMLQ